MVEVGGATMGTTWSARVIGSEADAGAYAAAVQGACDRVVAQMSPWERDAALSRFNALEGGQRLGAPAELLAVLRTALQVAKASGGAFDPTGGELADLWGFGPRPGPEAPDALAAEARSRVGWRRLTLGAGGELVQPGGLKLDLNGIAKGYAADLAARALESLGLEAFLVEVGGELVGRSVKPDGQPWWVDLEAPPESGLEPLRVALCDLAVATSGDWRRAFEHAGETLSHTLDPRTGRPSASGVAAVSVVHASCMEADAWATALSALEPEAGVALADAQGLAARIVWRDGDRVREALSGTIAAMLD
ncbi:MAG TPA: FAD:protein FMN transferase [Caulobacteraceae bacterium]